MCTAITYQTKDSYFGRTMDLSYGNNDGVAITPRNYPIQFLRLPEMRKHFAMIGMAMVTDGYPLYYEAVNEKGLCAAGLGFPGNAVYGEEVQGKENIAPYELIPYILGKCADIGDAKALLSNVNLLNCSYDSGSSPHSLHWLIADKNASVTVESVKEGVMVYENTVGVLANNPPFQIQMFNLNNYMQISARPPVNNFCKRLSFDEYSCGMGAIGLPGDWSSTSRFVRAVFTKMNSVCGDTEHESISQFFHLLENVAQDRGCSISGSGKYEFTFYSCCCNADKGIYYYTTYENSQISAVCMHHENLDANEVILYNIIQGQQIFMQN